MKRKLTPDELNKLEGMGYNTSSYKGELVDFPDAEPTSSVLGAGGRAALANAAPAIAGAAAGAGGWALGAALAPATGGLSFAIPLGASLVTGLGGSYLAKEAQDAITPQSIQERLALDAQEHPIATRVGGIASNLAVMRPSISMTRDAIKGAVQLPAASVAGSEALQTLNSVYRNALANVGLGAGLGGVTSAGVQLAETGSINPSDVLIDTLAGAALNKPTALGRTVMRLPNEPTARPIERPEELRAGQVAKPQQLDAHVGAMRESIAAQRQFNDMAVGLAEESMANQAKLNADVARISQNQKDMQDAINNALASIQDAGVVDVARQNKLADYKKMQEIDAAEQARIRDLETKTRDPLQKLEVTPEESAQDLEARRIEAQLSGEERPRYAKDRGPIQSPAEAEMQRQMAEQNLSTTPGRPLIAATDELLYRKNIGVQETRNLEARGRMFPEGQERKIYVNPDKETVDIRAHEGLHYEIGEIEKAASGGDARAKTFLDQLYSKQKEVLDAYNAKLKEAGHEPIDAHEFATTEQGARFIQEQLNLKKETSWKKWWNDTKALWNQRFGKNPSVDDLQRALNYRFVNREGMGTMGKRGPLGEVDGKMLGGKVVGPESRESKERLINSEEGDDVLSMTPEEQDVDVVDALPVELPPAPEGYRRVKVTKPDGGSYEAFFNDQYYDMGEMGKFASIAKQLPDGSLTHGVTKKGEVVQELPSQKYRREAAEGRGVDRTPREVQQDSPEFKKWFEGSKVVDKEGKPLVVYHGTSGDPFTTFKTRGAGVRGYTYGEGAYFTPDKTRASEYSGLKDYQIEDSIEQGTDSKAFERNTKYPARVYPVYTNLKKPYVVSSDAAVGDIGHRLLNKEPDVYLRLAQQIAKRNGYGKVENIAGSGVSPVEVGNEWLREQGYDGIIKQWKENDPLEIVAFYPEQIKSATGNRGTFDATNPDIRMAASDRGVERTPLAPDENVDLSKKAFFRPMEATFDKVERVSKAHAQAARNYEARRDQYTGIGNEALSKLEKFDRDEVNRVMEAHREAYRNDTEPTLTGPNDKAISEILSKYYGDIADARRELGIRINNREAGKNKYYVPDMMNAETLDVFINKPLSEEAKMLKEQWAQHVVEQTGGKMPVDKIRKDIDEYIGALNGKDNNYRSLEFGAIRRAAGYGLPEALRDVDAINTLSRYARRASADLAFFQEIQNRPEIAGPLHLKDQYGKTIQGYDSVDLSQSPLIQNMMQWITGNVSGRLQKQPKLNSLVRLVNNSLLGPATGIRDLVSVPVNALPYISRLSDLKAVWEGLINTRSNAADALRTAAKQPSIDRVQFQDILDAPDRTATFLNKAADLMRKAQGREYLENLSREITFSLGKELGRANILAAKAGDIKAKRWLEKFGTLVEGDVTKLEGEALEQALNQIGKNFTDRNQGTYGGRGLPLGVVDSQFAPFLSLQKWGLEKSNVIYNDVWKPFMTGENRLPMLTYALGSVMTGAAIQELNKLMSGKKGQDPTVKEALASGDPKNIALELVTLMQLGSYAGIMSDITKAASDSLIKGKTPRSVVSFPTASAAVRTSESVTDMLEAMRQGENPWEVLKAFTVDMASNNIQSARLIANRTGRADDVERSEKFRDRRVFDELEGKPAKEMPRTNPYLDLDAKEFKRTSDLSEAAKLAPKLVGNVVKGAKSAEALKKGLSGLKANSYQTIPSPEEQPEEFIRYMNFLTETQGKEEADRRLVDFFRQRHVNKVKSSMIP